MVRAGGRVESQTLLTSLSLGQSTFERDIKLSITSRLSVCRITNRYERSLVLLDG